MRKIFNLLLAVLLFFFLFGTKAQATTQSTSGNKVTFTNASKSDTLYLPITYFDGYSGTGDLIGLMIPFERTASIYYTVQLDSIDGQDPERLFNYMLYTFPTVTATWNKYVRANVNDTRVYFIINGQRYEINSKDYSIQNVLGANQITILVECDITGSVSPQLAQEDAGDFFEICTVSCSSFSGGVEYIGESEYSFLGDIKNNTTGVRTWLEYVNNTLLTMDSNLNTWLTRLHDDNNALSTAMVNWFKTINNNITTLSNTMVTWFGYVNTNLTDFKNTTTTWFVNIRDTLNTNFSNLSIQFDNWRKSLQADLTGWFDRQHQDLLDLAENLTSGYDTSDSDKISTGLDDSLGSLTDAENSLTEPALSGLGEFTVDSNGIGSTLSQYGGAIALVSAMMQAVYDSMGPYQAVIAVGFTVVIACMCLGFFRFIK